MGLVRIVIQTPAGEPFAGLGVTLRQTEATEPDTAIAREGTSDNEGVVRFRVSPGTFRVHLNQLPEGLRPPKYGTTVRLEDFAEGIEQIIRLAKAE
jgi:hypothetical protein